MLKLLKKGMQSSKHRPSIQVVENQKISQRRWVDLQEISSKVCAQDALAFNLFAICNHKAKFNKVKDYSDVDSFYVVA